MLISFHFDEHWLDDLNWHLCYQRNIYVLYFELLNPLLDGYFHDLLDGYFLLQHDYLRYSYNPIAILNLLHWYLSNTGSVGVHLHENFLPKVNNLDLLCTLFDCDFIWSLRLANGLQ